MNRELFFRLLQIAVVAPYIYRTANDMDSDYFRIGLKMVAGSIVVLNARPLFEAAKPTIKAALDYYVEAQKRNAVDKTEAIDGEYSELK